MISALGIRTPEGASDFEISVLLGPVGTPGPRTVSVGNCLGPPSPGWFVKCSSGLPSEWVGPWGEVGVVLDTGAGWEGGDELLEFSSYTFHCLCSREAFCLLLS